MKIKIIISLLCIFLFIGNVNAEPSNSLKNAIAMYKIGNYLGCINNMKKIVESDPGNAIAHYYLAISYVRAGQKSIAIQEYNNVITLSSSSILTEYAKKGLSYIDSSVTFDESKENDLNKLPSLDSNKIIPGQKNKQVSPINEFSDDVKKKLKEKKLERVKEIINSGKKLAPEKLHEFEDFSKKRQKKREVNKEKTDNSQPTNDQIVSALRVLQKAGLNNIGSNKNNQYTNPKALEMNMLMGSMGMNNPMGGMNNNNAGGMNVMNMLPLLMMNNQGQNNNNMDPKMMESMITGMMMPNMFSSFDSGKNSY